MNRFVFLFLITCSCFLTQSCQRKAIHKKHPDFVGHWRHKKTNGESWHLDIGEKSWGTISIYNADGSYSANNKYGENPRRWRYNSKKQELTNGMISERFKVNQLPGIAETIIISGFDTIQASESYFIMNGDYYVKSN